MIQVLLARKSRTIAISPHTDNVLLKHRAGVTLQVSAYLAPLFLLTDLLKKGDWLLFYFILLEIMECLLNIYYLFESHLTVASGWFASLII